MWIGMELGIQERPIQEWVEEGGDFEMVWEGSSVGVLLKLGRCSIDQEQCVKNLSFVRRQGWELQARSEADGKDSPLRGETHARIRLQVAAQEAKKAE